MQQRTPFVHFAIPAVIVAAALALVGGILGWVALATAVLLAILEVTLSFDNAVVNAKVLEDMDAAWRRRFLTWGILIAVFLTRALLPILIVSASTFDTPWSIARLALLDPQQYTVLLEGARFVIASFGAMFLVMAGLRYFFDIDKKRHWIAPVEKYLSSWGSIESIEIVLALFLLAIIAVFLPAHSAEVLFSGIVGIMLFIVVQGVAGSFSRGLSHAATRGFALFVYLNVLDAAFSLDSVVGAFALSSQLLVIVVGLGIGAYFVRSLTLYMVERGTLKSLVYLEHGAHWAILGLAGAMIANLFVSVPEPITGLIGLLFVGAAYLSSLRLTPGSPEMLQ